MLMQYWENRNHAVYFFELHKQILKMLDRVASNIFYGLTNFLSSQILIMVRCFGVIQFLGEEDVDALCMITFTETLYFFRIVVFLSTHLMLS